MPTPTRLPSPRLRSDVRPRCRPRPGVEMLFSPTRMPRRIFFASLLASACSFDGDGTEGNPNLGPGSADASSSGNDPSEGEPSSSDPSETTGDDPTGETTTPVGTTGNEPGDPARLLYAPEALDFGN